MLFAPQNTENAVLRWIMITFAAVTVSAWPLFAQLIPHAQVSPQQSAAKDIAEDKAETPAEAELQAVRAFQAQQKEDDKADMVKLQELYDKYMPEPPEPPPMPEPGEEGEPPPMPEPPPEFTREAEPIWGRIQDRREEIIARYDAYLEKYPQSWQAMDDLANYLYENGDPLRAKELWLQALELQPDSADLHNNLGVYYSHFGEPLKAVDGFRRAIELQPDKAVSFFNLATMYFTSRYVVLEREGWDLPTVYWKSQEAYERAFELEPDNFEYAINCAQNFYMAHFFKVHDVWTKAAEGWKRCLELDLSDAQKAYVHTNLGRVYRKMGEYEMAKTQLRKSLAAAVTPVAEHLLKKVTEEAENNKAESSQNGN